MATFGSKIKSAVKKVASKVKGVVSKATIGVKVPSSIKMPTQSITSATKQVGQQAKTALSNAKIGVKIPSGVKAPTQSITEATKQVGNQIKTGLSSAGKAITKGGIASPFAVTSVGGIPEIGPNLQPKTAQAETGLQTPETPNTPVESKFGQSAPVGTPGGMDFASPEAAQKFQAQKDIGTQMKQGLEAIKSTGAVAPMEGGVASAVVDKSLKDTEGTPPPQGGQDFMDNMALGEDQGWADIQKEYDDFEKTKSVSLVDTYKELVKDSGVQDLDEKLLDLESIINGTEEDIRNEITAAGGFATESQVYAMTSARNKNAIAEYNNLEKRRDNMMKYIDQQIGLTKADRDFAIQEFDMRMGYQEKKLAHRDRMVDNARETYNTIVKNVGYDGLLQATGGNPYYTSLAEKALGLNPGGLQQLATLPPSEKEQLELENQRLQNANLISQIGERNSNAMGTLNGKPQNASQASANGYADRLNQSNIVISELGSKFTGALSIGGSLPNIFQSANRQSYEQAKRDFVTAVLRRESGAAISDTEFDREELKYFPRAGDKPEVVAQKEKGRNTAINNLYREANVNRPVVPGQIIESDGKQYRVESDGETLTEL